MKSRRIFAWGALACDDLEDPQSRRNCEFHNPRSSSFAGRARPQLKSSHGAMQGTLIFFRNRVGSSTIVHSTVFPGRRRPHHWPA